MQLWKKSVHCMTSICPNWGHLVDEASSYSEVPAVDNKIPHLAMALFNHTWVMRYGAPERLSGDPVISTSPWDKVKCHDSNPMDNWAVQRQIPTYLMGPKSALHQAALRFAWTHMLPKGPRLSRLLVYISGYHYFRASYLKLGFKRTTKF